MRGDTLKTVVYADILIIINFLVNYLLLRAEAAITSFSFKSWRILLSSFVGGMFSLIIFIENIPTTINTVIKIICMSAMILIAFKIKSFKAYLKHFFAFLAVNFIFGGIMLAINVFLFPDSSVYNNGIVYFDMDILTLTLVSVACYAILNLINKYIKSKTPPKCIYTIRINYKNKTAEGNALFDSGNTLCDCFSGRPVIIAEKDFIRGILNGEEIECTKNFRLIPFSTIKGNGALPAFLADSVGIYISGKWCYTEKIYIGVTENKITSGSYSVLFGSPFFDTLSDKLTTLKGG